MFDIECPQCRSPKAMLAYEHPWCYLCPQCEHVWATATAQSRPTPQTLTVAPVSHGSRPHARSAHFRVP